MNRTAKELLRMLQENVMGPTEASAIMDSIRKKIAEGETTWEELGGEETVGAAFNKAVGSLSELCAYTHRVGRFGPP